MNPPANPVLFVGEPVRALEMAMTRAEVVVRPQVPRHVRERRIKRQQRLSALGYKNYADYLRSPHWARLKLQYRASELPQECVCGETEVHLHHMTYERIGEERLADLTPLCGPCHSLVHVLEFRGDMSLDLEGFTDEERAERGRQVLAELAEQARRQRAEKLKREQAEVLAMSFAARLLRVCAHARMCHINISGQLHVVKSMARNGASDTALTNRLRAIEEKVYGWEGWR